MVSGNSREDTQSYDSTYEDIFFESVCHPRKIYCCMSEQSTTRHTLLDNPTILHTKTFFAPSCHLRLKILSTSIYVSNTHLSQNIYHFPYLGLGLGLGLRSNQPITCNRYKSLHVNKRVASYFYFYVFASTIKLTKTGECLTKHILRKYYTLYETG